jgi:peptide/nickel transport system substrate-binding protein
MVRPHTRSGSSPPNALRKLLLVALLVSACAPSVPPAASGTRSGGTLVFAWQQPETLNPLYSTGTQTNALAYRLTVEGLVGMGPDGAPYAALADAIPTIENGGVTIAAGAMTVRYRLRSGVVWSDGAPFDARDVAFTWRTIMGDPRVATREGYDQIDGVDVPDDQTAVVRYRGIDPAYATRFDAILPRHLLEGAAQSVLDAYGRTPLGTGPFRITEFVAGDHLTAERNGRYRVSGRPYLDRVIIRFVASVDAAKAQLRAGEVDAMGSLAESDVADLERETAIAIASAPSPTVEAIAFNLASSRDPASANPVLGDIAVRRALVLATPKAQIVDRLLFGRATVAASEIPIGWAAASVAQEAYDPVGARTMLDKSGWLPGADGIRSKLGVRAAVRLVSTTGNSLRERVEQVLVDEWKAIGIEATIRNVPSSTLTGGWQAGGIRKVGDFDALLANVGLGIGSVDPQSYLAQRHRCASIPSAANNGAGANYERFCDGRVDALLDDAGATIDQAKRAGDYGQVLAILNEKAIAIWLYDRGRYDAFRTRVGGYRSNGWDVVTWNAQDWFVRP